MARGNIKIISTNLTGNIAEVSASTLAANKYKGLNTDTANVIIDNNKHTIAVDVNTTTMLTRKEAFTELNNTKEEILTETDNKIEALDLIGYEVIEHNN